MTMEIDTLHDGKPTRNGIDPCNTCADWLALKAENEALRSELNRLCNSRGCKEAIDDAAYFCLMNLASVETHYTNLRDHPEAWAAIMDFAEKVRIEVLGAAREDALDRMAENAASLHLTYERA